MKNESSANENLKQPRMDDWAMKILGAFLVVPALTGAFGSLQMIARQFSSNMNDLNLFNNWIAWLATLWFMLGWFIVNWIENALLDKRIKLARMLALVFFLALTSGICFFEGLVEYGALQRFFNMSPQLFFSGAFLRLSMFRQETLPIYRKAFFSLGRQK